MTLPETIRLPGGVAIRAKRGGERVTGCVELPGGRTIPIDYRLQRPKDADTPRTCLRASVPASPRSAKAAFDAVCLCVWWCFRFTGMVRIDKKLVNMTAIKLFGCYGIANLQAMIGLADVLSVVDCPYSVPIGHKQQTVRQLTTDTDN